MSLKHGGTENIPDGGFPPIFVNKVETESSLRERNIGRPSKNISIKQISTTKT